MALHTKKEFALLVGKPVNKLWTPIDRGFIILLGDGMIDDTDPRNKAYIEKWTGKKTPELPQTDQKQSEPASNLDKYTLEVEKLEKGNKKLDVETRLAELKEEKIRGEVIPVTLVTTIFKAHSQSIVSSQKDFIEFLLIQVSKEARLTGDQLAKLRGKMVIGLNEAVDKSIASSKRNLKSLINEYSIARGVGEHE